MVAPFQKLRNQPESVRTFIVWGLALVMTGGIAVGFFLIPTDTPKQSTSKAPSPLKVFGESVKATFEKNPIQKPGSILDSESSPTASVTIINATQTDFDETRPFETNPQ